MSPLKVATIGVVLIASLVLVSAKMLLNGGTTSFVEQVSRGDDSESHAQYSIFDYTKTAYFGLGWGLNGDPMNDCFSVSLRLCG